MRHLWKQGRGRKLLSAVLIHHSGPSRHISTSIIAGVEAPVGRGASSLRLSLPRGARPLRARHHQPGQGQHGILRPHLKLHHGLVLRQSPGNRLGGGYQSPTYSVFTSFFCIIASARLRDSAIFLNARYRGLLIIATRKLIAIVCRPWPSARSASPPRTAASSCRRPTRRSSTSGSTPSTLCSLGRFGKHVPAGNT